MISSSYSKSRCTSTRNCFIASIIPKFNTLLLVFLFPSHKYTEVDTYTHVINMPRNTLQPRKPRFRSSSSVTPTPGGTFRHSQASEVPRALGRGVKRPRPHSPFRDFPTRILPSGSKPSSASISANDVSPANAARITNNPGSLHLSTLSAESEHPVPRVSGDAMDIPDEVMGDGGDDDHEHDIILAVDYRSKRLGCTFYTESDETLWFVNDIQVNVWGAGAATSRDMLDGLKFQIQPTVILFPSRADELFAEGEDNETLNSASGTSLNVRPAQEFSVEQGRNKLAGLNFYPKGFQDATFITPDNMDLMDVDSLDSLLGGPDHLSGNKQSILRLDSYIDTENNWVSVGCAGAVLTHVRRQRAIRNPHDDHTDSLYGVSRIKLWTMRDTMFVNSDTMTSLQIFNDESHPSFHRQGEHGRGREGLSLFGIINTTSTPQGYQCLKQMFLRPSLDLGIISSRYNAIHALMRPDNSNAVGGIHASLKKIPDIAKTLAILKKGGASGGTGEIEDIGIGGRQKGRKNTSTSTWFTLLQFAYKAIKIRDYATEMIGVQEVDVFRKLIDRFEIMHLRNVGKLIDDTVDFEESKYQGRVCVKAGIDDELDNMKNLYNGLEHLLNEAAQDTIDGLPIDAKNMELDLSVVYYPQLGYLLCVPKGPDGRPIYSGSATEDDDENAWTFMFSTDQSCYYKSDKMRALDEQLGDIFGLICDKEIDILHDLQEKVMRYRDILLTCSSICGELDSLMSLAQASVTYNLVRPLITESNTVKIHKGRHLLQELCVSTFIPNDTYIEGGTGTDEQQDGTRDTDTEVYSKSMVIVTGPNYSGKSVYLKQVALIVYMAHIGCFVPAESATIGITDAILTRIQTRESVTKTQSAFMIDLQQIAAALRLTSRRTLLVVDEFGKGTESTDGAGLACAVAEHLLNLGPEAPKTLMATHYHEIFENGFLTSHPSLTYAHMKILLDQAADSAQNQITYLYTLESGRSSSSFGTVCAAMNGVDKIIIDRAEDLIIKLAKGEDLTSVCAVMTTEEAREFAYAEHVARQFLQIDLDNEMTEEDMHASSANQATKAALEKIFDGRLA
ncbi:hypothetical protein ABW19_dt0205564 [Dactylella cylindrospora]|nr:hypothetical protein ABW19_dt0205564 [Dactylella cylindrospora]